LQQAVLRSAAAFVLLWMLGRKCRICKADTILPSDLQMIYLDKFTTLSSFLQPKYKKPCHKLIPSVKRWHSFE
jgi:hypothetical protein